jgi:hypothetical protein
LFLSLPQPLLLFSTIFKGIIIVLVENTIAATVIRTAIVDDDDITPPACALLPHDSASSVSPSIEEVAVCWNRR